MLGETGANVVVNVVRGSRMSAVIASQCCSRGVVRDATPADVPTILNTYDIESVPFDLPFAIAAARLREATRRQGTSLGDRASGRPVYTGDRRLAEVDPWPGIDILPIR